MKTIRENQSIRANLRIDSRESGHLSEGQLNGAIFMHLDRLRPKGVGEEGVGEKLNRVFSGLFPWQVREWYVPGPSRHHQIPNFLRTLHLFQQIFSGFNRAFSGL